MSAFDDSIIDNVSCINNSDTIFYVSFELLNGQWMMGLFVCFIIQDINSLLVKFCIVEEVFWWSRKIFANFLNKLVFISNQEGIIVLTLSF